MWQNHLPMGHDMFRENTWNSGIKCFLALILRQPGQITCGPITYAGVMLPICNISINMGVFMVNLYADLSFFPFLPVLQPVMVLVPLLFTDSTPSQKTQGKNWAQHVFSCKQGKILALIEIHSRLPIPLNDIGISSDTFLCRCVNMEF